MFRVKSATEGRGKTVRYNKTDMYIQQTKSKFRVCVKHIESR